MPLQFTAARSSRITKPKPAKPPPVRAPAKKPAASNRSKARRESDEEDSNVTRLENHGPVRSFARQVKLRDVPACLEYIANTMFDDIPQQRSGMNSTRTSEVLNYRRRLPPLATVTHVYSLSSTPTNAEREIARLIVDGVVRKMLIPGRGLGTASIGEFVILTSHWMRLVEENEQLSDGAKQAYISALKRNPSSTTVSSSAFTPSGMSELIQAGFLTTATVFTRELPGAISAPDAAMRGSLSSLAAAGSDYASGSLDAVGGSSAIHDVGGRLKSRPGQASHQMLNFSLPSVGVYLKLLAGAREHLVSILSKTKFRESPADMLRERWDGGLSSSIGHPSRTKGLTAPVLPGRTRKWKQYYGMRFQWALEECLGTGAVECFDTRTVGLGVRVP